MVPELIPLTLACSEIEVPYLRGRDLGLSGTLKMSWVGGRLFVTRESVEAFKASRRGSPPVQVHRNVLRSLVQGGAA
jgi:hypothetical protein